MNNTKSRYPIRQHSLQDPPRYQQQIRRQRSTEDDINQQVYLTNSLVFHNKFSINSSKYNNHRMLDRSSVRVAWSKQSIKSKSNVGIELVAQQISTRKSNKLITKRDNKKIMGIYPLEEKATILYTRQELAERLRHAWKEREKNKSNIDIFLTHNTMEERSDSRMSTNTNLTSLSTPKIQKKRINSIEIETKDENVHKNNTNNDKKKKSENKKFVKIVEHEFQTWFSSNIAKKNTIRIAENQLTDNNVKEINESKKITETIQEEMQKVITEKKACISIDCHNWNTSLIISNKSEDITSDGIKHSSKILVKEPDYSHAKLKRTNYQSCLNKAFVNQIVENPSTPRITSRNNTFQERVRFRRTNSAPAHRQTQMNIIIDTPSIFPCTTSTESEKWIMKINDQSQSIAKYSINTNRPIKSAPSVKRRSKLNKRRSLSMTSSKNGESEIFVENSRSRTRHVKTGKNIFETKSTDVVTMVSLVSSADSESEIDETLSRDNKFIYELRNKLPTTPIIKSSNRFSDGIRKPFKSVSFQQNSLNRENFELGSIRNKPKPTLGSRLFALSKGSLNTTIEMGITVSDNIKILSTASKDIAVPTTIESWGSNSCESVLMHSDAKLALIEATLTDCEKRCLIVPIGNMHDKKRKLFRCRNAIATLKANDFKKQLPDTNQVISQITSRNSVVLQEKNLFKINTNPLMSITEIDTNKNKNLPTKSYCQTPKEKECWHLYRKMCDKGVFVSFDTVLRGMLTPTEYRLRQKEVSQNC